MQNSFFQHLSFRVETSHSLTKLAGWKKTYRIPDRFSSESEAFVASCATDQIRADLDEYFAKLRNAFGLTRRELQTNDADGGCGTIVTPFFTYTVQVQLKAEELEEVRWTRVIDRITHYDMIESAPFAEVFDEVFDTVQVAFPKLIVVEDFIDAVESAKIPELAIEYDRGATYCDLLLKGENSRITLTPRSLSIVHRLPIPTGKLLKALDSIRRVVGNHQVPLAILGK